MFFTRTDRPITYYGQCAITAMLVYDMFGGTIHRIRKIMEGHIISTKLMIILLT